MHVKEENFLNRCWVLFEKDFDQCLLPTRDGRGYFGHFTALGGYFHGGFSVVFNAWNGIFGTKLLSEKYQHKQTRFQSEAVMMSKNKLVRGTWTPQNTLIAPEIDKNFRN
jgi:hypothetical protein